MESRDSDFADRKRLATLAVERLTARERDVLKGLVAGESNKAIARFLGISPRTVEIHRTNLKRKLGASSTADLVRIGIYSSLDADETSSS